MTAVRDTMRRLAADRGWLQGSDLEDRACRMLHNAGFRPKVDVEQQYRVGRYRLDFAWPEMKIALEVDGPRHLFDPDTALKDATRDAFLRSEGWLVFRVDAKGGPDGIDDQLARVCGTVHALRWAPTGRRS